VHTNSKDGFIERYAKEEASEFLSQKNMKAGHHVVEARISDRQRNDTF
jgi:hypothetical protein